MLFSEKRKCKIFDYCWHISHQYDMINALHNDCDFFYGITGFMQWDKKLRPVPEGLQFVTHYEPATYDLAILHLDQRCIVPHSLEYKVFAEFNEIIKDIPKVIINHGTPVYPEASGYWGHKYNPQEMEVEVKRIIRSLVGDKVMVVNSYTAATTREWGSGIPIIHGLNPGEWKDAPKEPRVFSALPLQGLDSYYNRKCLRETGEYLYDRYGYTIYCANFNITLNNSFEKYRNFLGRSLLYLDTSFRTPMNRARTEAFLSGCCVLQVQNAHDLELWAKDGENIMLVPNDPKAIAAHIADILENKYEEAINIGQRGKEMATKQFNRERYRQDWLQLIKSVLQKEQVASYI